MYYLIFKGGGTLGCDLEIAVDDVEDCIVIDLGDSTLIGNLLSFVDVCKALANNDYILKTELLVIIWPLLSLPPAK